MVFNEPETSLHPSLLPSLAELIARASVDTQLIIVTHAREFATGIAERCPAKVVDLVSYEDETRPATQATGKRVWEFEG
jgi:predicted ATPase